MFNTCLNPNKEEEPTSNVEKIQVVMSINETKTSCYNTKDETKSSTQGSTDHSFD